MENPKHRYGESHGKAKLNNEQIKDIIHLYKTGIKQRVLATEFGVNQRTISNIVTRKSWSHLNFDE